MPAADPAVILITTAHREGNTGPSQDRVFIGTNSVVVLDGATQPDQSHHNGGWLADQLGIELMRRLETAPGVDLRSALSASIEAIVVHCELSSDRAATTAVSIVRWFDADVDVLVLGSSPVIARRRGGEVRIVRDDVPEAAGHAIRASWPAADLECVAVMTDGVADGVERYGIPADWTSALDLAADSPRALVDSIHAAEESDPHGVRWPRRKLHDDKAIAVLTFAPAATSLGAGLSGDPPHWCATAEG